jgi:hypothetical protein
MELCEIYYCSGEIRTNTPFIMVYSIIKAFPMEIILPLANELISIMSQDYILTVETIPHSLPILAAFHNRQLDNHAITMIKWLATTVHSIDDVFVMYNQAVAVCSDVDQDEFFEAVEYYQHKIGS